MGNNIPTAETAHSYEQPAPAGQDQSFLERTDLATSHILFGIGI